MDGRIYLPELDAELELSDLPKREPVLEDFEDSVLLFFLLVIHSGFVEVFEILVDSMIPEFE